MKDEIRVTHITLSMLGPVGPVWSVDKDDDDEDKSVDRRCLLRTKRSSYVHKLSAQNRSVRSYLLYKLIRRMSLYPITSCCITCCANATIELCTDTGHLTVHLNWKCAVEDSIKIPIIPLVVGYRTPWWPRTVSIIRLRPLSKFPGRCRGC